MSEENETEPFMKWWWPLLLAVMIAIALAWVTNVAFQAQGKPTSWTELRQMVADDKIEKVEFEGPIVQAKLKQAEDEKPKPWIRVVAVPDDATFLPLLEEHGVDVKASLRNDCASGISPYFFTLLIIVGFLWFFFVRQSGPTRGMAAFGQSTAQMAPEDGTGVSFDDVAGVDEAKEELEEVVAFLKTPEKFTLLGGRPPKGVLLVGPPGTGKTLLARAVAGEAGVPFFSISGSAFVEMFVGVGAARVRDLFKNANEHAPCIIFIDELDAVGKSRGSGPTGNEEREQTLNQLLVEMDGFDSRRGIIMMAATNRPETLDAALLRPGRFDRQVLVDRPDFRGRKEILVVHGKSYKLSEAVNLEKVARMTPGLAGADLANLLNEAALLAARQEKSSIGMDDIGEAFERVVAGLEKKSRRLSDSDKRLTAYHECGHAICSAASPGADPVHKISIIPRGMALGYTLTLPAEDRFSANKSQLLNRIVTLFGGRAAEALVFNDVTTGAQDDIRRATDIARKMVTEYGMSKKLGAVNYGAVNQNMYGIGAGVGGGTSASPDTAERIEEEVRALLESGQQRAVEILVKNRTLLEEMSLYLIEQEVLEGDIMETYLSRAQQVDSVEDRATAEWIPTMMEPGSPQGNDDDDEFS